MTNNCEHFAKWCCIDSPWSRQVEAMEGITAVLAVAAGFAIGAAWDWWCAKHAPAAKLLAGGGGGGGGRRGKGSIARRAGGLLLGLGGGSRSKL